MRFLPKKRSKKEQMAQTRRKRMGTVAGGRRNLFATNRLSVAAAYLALSMVVAMICFFGQNPAGLRLSPGQPAQSRVIANFDFTYQSQELTERARALAREQVAPRYKLERDVFRNFRDRILQLSATLEEPDTFFELLGEEDQEPWLVLQRAYPRPSERKDLLEEKLEVVRQLMQEGVRPDAATPRGEHSVRVFGRSQDEALRQLRFSLRAVDPEAEPVPPEVADALIAILSKGIQPNLVTDLAALQRDRNRAAAAVQPVYQSVEQGEVVIEPGQLDALDRERYQAYVAERREREQWGQGFNLDFLRKAIAALALLGGAIAYINVSLPQLGKSPRRLTLVVLILLLNLCLMRLTLMLQSTDFFVQRLELSQVIPFLVTTAIGPMILTMMIGAAPAVLMSLLLAAFNGLMQGSSMEVFVASLLAGLVAVLFSRDVRQRVRVIRAGLASGTVMGAGAFFFGIFHQELNFLVILWQVFASLGTGIVAGMVVVALLPYLENLFHYITDITLLELTDYNHPLLRRMQMVAPGTYHHSLMVANLSERAAQEIGCNALVCRASSLFHDIGKMTKAEYFIENQNPGENPHLEKNPSMSALIIKSHVKEGAEMARQAKLPLLLIDIIQQHHGTTLIRYFYEKARSRQAQSRLPLGEAGAPAPADGEEVDEAGFRYDGPRPRFKESGIIFFADAVEAASRTLKKVTPQSIEELIDRIFDDRIEDHQLDECPLTCREINHIKRSFAFTLLNMMHARVEYPAKREGQSTRTPFVAEPAPPQPPLPAGQGVEPPVSETPIRR